MKFSVLAAAALAATFFSGSAHATLVYNNGAPIFIGANMTQDRSADDFTLASAANITDVRFFSSVFSGTFAANFSGDISWAIYNDSAGALGTLISSGAVTGLTGSPSGSFFQLDFGLGSPVALGAGTYWLELHEGATLSSNDGIPITWTGLAGGPASNARQSTNLANVPNTDIDFELAFQLFDNTAAVPEPASALLLAGPLAAILWYRGRRVS